MNTYPFIKIAIYFSAGIVAGRFLSENNLAIPIIILFLLIAFFVIINSKNKPITKIIIQIIIVLLIYLIGIAIYQLSNNKIESKLSEYVREKNCMIYGSVEEIELKRDYEIAFVLKSDSIIISGQTIRTNENILCRLRSDSLDRALFYNLVKPGNKISFRGIFMQARGMRNPGEFDYRKFLLSKGITGIFISYDSASIEIINSEYSYFKNLIFSARKSIDELIRKLHNKQTAALLRGLLLADRTEIDYETKQNFVNAGVIHILAVSGLHVGYILLFFIILFGRFNIYLRSFLTIIGLLLFMIITGIPASVFRATLMSIILIIAFLSGRSANLINSIAISAVIILLFRPNEIFSPGFQLSYSAVLSIALIFPLAQKQIFDLNINNNFLRQVLLFVSVTLSAQIGTLPFTLAYFNKLSLIAIFSNLIVIPLVGIIVALAILTLLIGSIFPVIAVYFALTNNLLVSLMMDIVKYSGSIEFAFIRINNFSSIDSTFFFAFLGLLIYALNYFQNNKLKALIILFVAINIYIYSLLDDKKFLPDGIMSLLMIDVGQGDAFLIKFPNGQTALIDAGNVDPFFDNGERVIIPLLDYLGIDEIDYGFVSHLDSDHYGGFASLIYNKRVGKIYRTRPDSTDKSIRFENFLNKHKVQKETYRKGKIVIGNCAVYFLNDEEFENSNNLSSNDRSGLIKIVFGTTSFLFVGDAEYASEQHYASKYPQFLDSDVLKISHHGSATGSSAEFLQKVSPRISLISAGVKNKFGHPSEIVLQRLKDIDSEIFRTDSLGAVLIQSDGKEIKVVDWRNN